MPRTSDPRESFASVGVTMHARKANLYVKSLAPNDLRPVIPSEAPVPRSGGAGRD